MGSGYSIKRKRETGLRKTTAPFNKALSTCGFRLLHQVQKRDKSTSAPRCRCARKTGLRSHAYDYAPTLPLILSTFDIVRQLQLFELCPAVFFMVSIVEGWFYPPVSDQISLRTASHTDRTVFHNLGESFCLHGTTHFCSRSFTSGRDCTVVQ